MPLGATLCAFCKHRSKATLSCAAYPDEIPAAIFGYGTLLHFDPLPGDHGIQYERADQEELERRGLDTVYAKEMESYWRHLKEQPEG